MTKIPFDIKYRQQIESGEYKVVTAYGDKVEIVKWDCNGNCPILALINDGVNEESCFYDNNGISRNGSDKIYVVTSEPDLTEFEDKLGSIMFNTWSFMKGCPEFHDDFKYVRECANELLDIAWKESTTEYSNIPWFKLSKTGVFHYTLQVPTEFYAELDGNCVKFGLKRDKRQST